jgi:hypothetical protein
MVLMEFTTDRRTRQQKSSFVKCFLYRVYKNHKAVDKISNKISTGSAHERTIRLSVIY